tara:strand:+ start:1311 stop:1550 length:240 start_codon:yes stop_codon:yes gene_type:complete
MLKILILKTDPNIYLMGTMTELDEEPSILIEECVQIVDGELIKYPLYTDQRDLFMNYENVFTILDPSADMKTKYAAINA